ncbi:uncharacterized protein LOC131887731 [Tigriopus californicus]|uniref:uncharacterized protein LOC131887731 n=1 Tax=Tigriopus californicus TaxID=6832 RepID=UPI0027DA39C3|nr:uncharacterized protein LOC131887731 [Tigriopus californicus]
MQPLWILACILLPLAGALITPEEQGSKAKHIIDTQCEELLKDWMFNYSPELNQDDASLTINCTELDQRVQAQGCIYDKLWIELWRLDHKVRDVEKYASWDYLSKYQRCESMEHFQVHESFKHSIPSHNSTTIFHHVVQEHYVLRLCPCGRRKPDSYTCDCESSSAPLCSKLITFHRPTNSTRKVFDVCGHDRNDSSALESSEGATIKAPRISCSSTTIAGTMASCTPLQDYDKVQILLHPNPSNISNCGTHDHGDRNVSRHTVSLEKIDGNLTHGRFTLELTDLVPETAYCIVVDLSDDHPYCKRNIEIGSLPKHLPPICRTAIKTPLVIASCPNATKLPMVTNGWLLVILSLIIILGVTFCLLIIWCVWTRRATSANNADLEYSKKAPATFDTGTGSTSVESLKEQTIFLLSFNESSLFMDLNFKLVQWLEAVGVKVVHFDDDNLSEEICENQENFVVDKIHDPNTRVIIVNTQTAVDALKSSSSQTNMDSPTMPLTSVEDSFYELRLLALRQIHSQFAGNYKKVLVINYSGQKPMSGDIENITHQRQCVLPCQFVELAHWLKSFVHPYSSAVNERDGGALLPSAGTKVSTPLSNQRIDSNTQKLVEFEEQFREAFERYKDSRGSVPA